MDINLVLHCNQVFSGTDHLTRPASLAIAQDTIVAIGSREEVNTFVLQNHTGARAPLTRDFGDAFVLPGFHDSHLHFFHSALYSSPFATTFLGSSEADCVEKLVEFSKQRPHGWLLAQGWREYRWNPPQLPSKHSLDATFPTRPVALYSGDAHTLWLNSAALQELNLDCNSIAPDGGSYDRDHTGELTGIIREAAAMELMPRIMNSFSDAEIYEAYKGFLIQLASSGITSVCDMSLMASPGLDFIRDDIHAKLLANNELTARIHLFPTLLDDTQRFEKMLDCYTDPLLQACGFKQFFDGVSSQHTAWVSEPYSNAHYEGDCGSPTVNPATMRSYIMNASSKGYPVRIHTIGDAAIHEALNIFEDVQKEFGKLPQGKHHCLEHLENLLPEDLERLSKLGVICAVQPPHMTLDPGGPESDLGAERIPLMWPFRSLIDYGNTLAFGTDAPVVSINPLNVLYSSVTRQDPTTHEPSEGWLPEQRISMAEALFAYTQGSASCAGRSHELGTLEVGMLADFVVLDQNLLTCKNEEIQGTNIVATFVGGACVYETTHTI